MQTPIKLRDCLLSEAVGDICGSPWEFAPYKQLTTSGLQESVMSFVYYTRLYKRVII